MTPEDQMPPLPEIGPVFDHPEHHMKWSRQEIAWIKDYATDYALAALAQQAQEPVAWRDEVQRLSAMASTAMNQTARDQRNILEGIADRLCALTATPQPQPAPPVPAPVDEREAWIVTTRPVAVSDAPDARCVKAKIGNQSFHIGPDYLETAGDAEVFAACFEQALRRGCAALQSPAPQTKGQP